MIVVVFVTFTHSAITPASGSAYISFEGQALPSFKEGGDSTRTIKVVPLSIFLLLSSNDAIFFKWIPDETKRILIATSY